MKSASFEYMRSISISLEGFKSILFIAQLECKSPDFALKSETSDSFLNNLTLAFFFLLL